MGFLGLPVSIKGQSDLEICAVTEEERKWMFYVDQARKESREEPRTNGRDTAGSHSDGSLSETNAWEEMLEDTRSCVTGGLKIMG